MICVKFTAFCDLRAGLRIRLATPYASSGFGKLASTCESVWPGLNVKLNRTLVRAHV